IGRPIANTRVYVLDGNGGPVPVGVGGELYIGGEGLARGYVNRAELTAQRFVPDGLSGAEGQRLYRSGDLCRYLADGNLEFIGRKDQQVKGRGYRIELGEIEARLGGHPGVRESVVVARETDGGEKQLVGYVVMEEGGRAEELRAYLKERLPEYMVPAFVVRLERLPLTANGKVDRRSLPAPEGAGGAVEGHVAPRTAVEEILAGLYEEVLRVGRGGRSYGGGCMRRWWGGGGGGCATIFSSWGAIRCWPRGWCRGCGRVWGWSWRCGASLKGRAWGSWPGKWRSCGRRARG